MRWIGELISGGNNRRPPDFGRASCEALRHWLHFGGRENVKIYKDDKIESTMLFCCNEYKLDILLSILGGFLLLNMFLFLKLKFTLKFVFSYRQVGSRTI